jgi:hypothetical protein
MLRPLFDPDSFISSYWLARWLTSSVTGIAILGQWWMIGYWFEPLLWDGNLNGIRKQIRQ